MSGREIKLRANQYCAYEQRGWGMVLLGRLRAQDNAKARRAIRSEFPKATHYSLRGREPWPLSAKQETQP